MCSKYLVLYFFLSVTRNFVLGTYSYFRLRAYVEKIKLSSGQRRQRSLKLKIPFAILCYLITILLGEIEGIICLSCVRNLAI